MRVRFTYFSTSNHNLRIVLDSCQTIVLYLYSTSNHNWGLIRANTNFIVLYLYSTSNHNTPPHRHIGETLSYTFILHQTTTSVFARNGYLYCLIPLFYIKPQPPNYYDYKSQIVLYLYSTSNHNESLDATLQMKLSYTFILHQTTTPELLRL